MNDVLREQIQLNTKEVVVNVDNDHMKASIVLNGIGSDEAYTYEEIADKLSQAGVRTGINEEYAKLFLISCTILKSW